MLSVGEEGAWISPRDGAPPSRWSRRELLRAGAIGLLGLSLGDWLERKARGAVREGKAKSVIQLWLGGGPSHLDTFDPKPDAGGGYTGPLRQPLPTNVAGVRIGELLPLLAKQADKYSLLRSLTHHDNSHETASYIMLTGTAAGTELVYPSIGSVVAFERSRSGARGALPPFIGIPSGFGRFSESGFLGSENRIFATGGDPSARDFRVQGIVDPAGVGAERRERRRALFQSIDTLARDLELEPEIQSLDAHRQAAYALMAGDAKQAFDLTLEKDATRDRYGRTRYGQSCLLARRLVEHGVPFVTVNWGGWDTHVDNFGAMKRLLPELDRALSSLLVDLSERGLLESTMVVCCGEFGRTPLVSWEPPWNGGRHHHGAVFSALVAGGGFKGGAVVGASDARGEAVRDRPIYPWDLSASMYQLLGIDPLGRLPHPHGCVAYVTPLKAGELPSGGLLSEIM